MRKLKILLFLFALSFSNLFAQFGQNRVQYIDYDWYYIQTKHFDIYFAKGAKNSVEFLAQEAEHALSCIERDLDYRIDKRISIILYNSHNDFQETNISGQFIGQGTGGFTEQFKNRVVIPFEGSYAKFRHVIHHELVHAVMNEYLYGGSLQNIVSKGIKLQLPIWYHEGSAEFLSSRWETNSDMFIRDAIINEYLPDIPQLSGYFAYRGGQSLFKYIADTYGIHKIAELLSKIKGSGSLEKGLKAALGLSLEELNKRWKKALKKAYWPAIATRKDPDDFAKRLTDNKKTGGFYNTSPAISPKGDKVAFISDRDIFLDVYVMKVDNPKEVKKVVESGQENDFEELNVLFPALTWSPDNIHIALAGKSSGYDNITLINTVTDDYEELPFHMKGIGTVAWSPDGKEIAFAGQSIDKSDIYIYNLKTKKMTNLTDDIFSDSDPVWSPDSKKIFFSSDRGKYLSKEMIDSSFNIFKYNYRQLDIYSINVKTKKISRITDWEFSDEKNPVISPDGKKILFVSDYNGISNIYEKDLVRKDSLKPLTAVPAKPLTNSLNGIYQLSASKDGQKLVFTSLFNKGYNIFLLKNPFEMRKLDSIKFTPFMEGLTHPKTIGTRIFADTASAEEWNDTLATRAEKVKNDSTKNVQIFTGGYVPPKSARDSTKKDYSHYVFGRRILPRDSLARRTDTTKIFKAKLDENGNYLISKYKVNFSPDLVYANAGYSTLYGLLGTTVLTFSDMLGNHRLIGITSMQIDLKNSDYGLAYYYLARRTNWGFQAFHTARFVYIGRDYFAQFYRFRDYGAIVSASYPFNRFYRMDASLGWLNVSSENLDDPQQPIEKESFLVPTLSFVHDNTLWGYTSPIQGTRYNLTVFGNPGITGKRLSFYSFTWDYRRYFRFFFDNSFAFRFSGGYSGGKNPQRFFVGGVNYWINRDFATGQIPLRNASDFAFLTPGLPLRGYNYAEQMGTKYSLLNLELRFPLIRYLVTGPLPLMLQNILGVGFIDAGSAWDNTHALKFLRKDKNGNLITQDLLIGTGFGFRLNFIFLWRFDIAWAYNFQYFTGPKYYLSMGLDF